MHRNEQWHNVLQREKPLQMAIGVDRKGRKKGGGQTSKDTKQQDIVKNSPVHLAFCRASYFSDG